MKTYNFYLFRVVLPALVFCSLFCSACSKQVISKEKFVDVYCDLSIAQDTLEFREFNTKKKDIIKKYGITEKELKTTYEYYYSNPELWEPFFKSATEKIEKLRALKTKK